MQRLDIQQLFTSGVDGYANYRIPAMVVTKKHTILAFCEARKFTGRDADQIDLFLRRSTDDGKTFSHRQLVTTQKNWVCGNPAPVVDQTTGVIHLLFTKNHMNDTERIICQQMAPRTAWITTSQDDGISWTIPREITEEVKLPEWSWIATGPGHGIQLKSGRLIIPCDHIVAKHFEPNDPYYSHIIYSDDNGLTWHIGGSADEGTNESTAFETKDGLLYLNCRNKSTLKLKDDGQFRAVCWSTDEGQTFSPIVRDAALPEPICQASVCGFPNIDGRSRVIFSNPGSRKSRSQMTIRLSYDECRSWPINRVLHKNSSAYSDLCVSSKNMICCFFESGHENPYSNLTFARFNLEWLTEGGIG